MKLSWYKESEMLNFRVNVFLLVWFFIIIIIGFNNMNIGIYSYLLIYFLFYLNCCISSFDVY